MKRKISNRGFTLIELIVVLAILGLLTLLIIPNVLDYTERANEVADLADLNTLNFVTSIYRADEPSSDPFIDQTKSNDVLMQFLVDQGFIENKLIPRNDVAEFTWSFVARKWVLNIDNGEIEITFTLGEYFTFISSSNSIVAYDGRGGTDLVIPIEIDGVNITQIGQSAMYYGYNSNTWAKLTSVLLPDTLQKISGNAFHSNALTSVDIPDSVTYLGANAFYGNQLTTINLGTGLTEIKGGAFAGNQITELVLPSGIKTVGDGAFQSNAITRVTIGSNVTLTKSTSLGTYGASFNTFYTSVGKVAGTYVYENGVWRRI